MHSQAHEYCYYLYILIYSSLIFKRVTLRADPATAELIIIKPVVLQ